MSKLVRSTEFENEDSVIILLDKIMEVVEEDIDNSAKKKLLINKAFMIIYSVWNISE